MKQMGTAKELTVEATVDNLNKVTSFVEEALEESGCPMKAQMQINIAIDEIFSNISYYAYQPNTGDVTVQLEISEEPDTELDSAHRKQNQTSGNCFCYCARI